MDIKLTTLQGPGGSTIYVQYDKSDETDELRAMGVFEDLGQRTAKFRETMREAVLGYSALIFNIVQEELDEIQRPDEIKLEFGLQVGGEAGIALITKGTANANVRVTLEWNLEKEKE